jgi:glycosyltransferase involved in cell wall biosynthesis
MDYPHISVIILAYDINELEYLRKSIDSVLEQDYDTFDIIAITEGDELTEKIRKSHSDISNVSIIQISNSGGGISEARNEGIKYADGDVIAYIDSDATAENNWLKNIGEIYAKDEGIIAVGGKAEPNWIGTRPWYLPDSFLWLVGVTHDGHPKDGTIVRNTFGCNISYKKEIFDRIDGFNSKLGKSHGFNLQGEESELGIRIFNEYGRGMYYAENALIKHTVGKHQTTLKWLSKRAYLQGITKAIMSNQDYPSELDVEGNYLKYLFFDKIPHHIKSIFRGNDIKKSIGSIFGILYFTILVGLGFIRGNIN